MTNETLADADEFWGTPAAPATAAQQPSIPSADDYWGPVKGAEPPKAGVLDRVGSAVRTVIAATPPAEPHERARRQPKIRPYVAGDGSDLKTAITADPLAGPNPHAGTPTEADLVQMSKAPATIERERAAAAVEASRANAPRATAGPAPTMVDTAAGAVRDVVGDRTLAGDLAGSATRRAGDLYLSASKIMPETLKLASDIVQLGTGGMSEGFSKYLQSVSDAMGAQQSSQLQAQHAQLSRILQDPNASVVDVAQFLATNPFYTVNAAIPSTGSMLLGAGGAVAGARLAGMNAARRGAVEAEIAAATQRGAVTGATAANAAMNAGSTFAETNGDLIDKYTAAGIAGAGTVAAGRLFGGGAEAALAGHGAPAASRLRAVAGTMGKEAGQEFGESVSQQAGQAVGEGRPFDANAIGKQAVLEGVMGGVMGAGAGMRTPVEAKQPSAEQLAKEKGFLRPVEQRKAAFSRFDDLAATHGMSTKAASAAKQAAEKVPLAELPGFFKRLAKAMSDRGLVGRPLDDAALTVLDEQPEQQAAQVTEENDAPLAAAEVLGNVEEPDVGMAVPAGDVAAAAPSDAVATEGDDQALIEAAPRTAQPLDVAAHEAAQSQLNGRPEPTRAQADAGNYKKGHDNQTFPGLDLSIESPVGSIRKDKENDPPKWQTEMAHHYGYIKGTQAADSTPERRQGIDFFAKPGTPVGHQGPVFVVDQRNKDGSFDEHKVMLGFDSEQEAREAYLSNYEEGWTGLGAITPMAHDEFKAWAFDGKKDAPLAYAPAAPAATASNTKRAAQARARRALDPERDTLLQALAKLGGISRDVVAREFGLKPEELKHSVSVGGLKGFPFRAKGGRGLDGAITSLREAGYFMGVADEDVRNAFEAAIYDEIGGKPHLTAHGQMYRAAQANEDERTALDAEAEAEAAAEREAIIAEAGLTPAEEAAIVADDDIPAMDAVGTASTEDFMRAMGFSEQEIADEIAREEAARRAQAGAAEAGAPRAEEASQGDRGARGEAQGSPPGEAGQEGLNLAAHGAADLTAKTSREAQADQLDERAAADAEREHFALQAQAAPEQRKDSTGDLFGGPSAEDVRAARTPKPVATPAGPDLFNDPEPAPSPAAKPPTPKRQAKPAKPVTPQVASPRQLEQLVAVAADSIERLRASDVERVLLEAPEHFRVALGAHIEQKRPDLAEEVVAARAELAQTQPDRNRPPDDEKMREAKLDAMRALADLADILGKPVRMNITPEQEQKLLPVLTRLFDAAFRMGYLQFKAAARFVLEQIRSALGPEAAEQLTIDHLQGAYIGMAGRYKDQGADRPAAVAAVQSIDEIDAQETPADNSVQEPTRVPNPDPNLERDRSDADAQDGALAPPVRARSGGAAGRAGEAGGDGGRGREGDAGLPADGSAAAGERGDQSLRGGERVAEPTLVPAGADLDPRGGGIGDGRVPPETVAADAPAPAVDAGLSDGKKRAAQRAADKLAVKPGDLANVRETLPYLLAGQQEDVHKAEVRFEKPDGFGMLFTNGTGTGKTFTGLGIVKRFARRGKTNTLIVAPSDKIIADWIDSAKALGLDVSRLAGTNDAGRGIVITTYANLGQNLALGKRDWDLIVADEAHYLSQDKDGTTTTFLKTLRAISLHPGGAHTLATMRHADLYDRAQAASEAASQARESDNQAAWDMISTLEERAAAAWRAFDAKKDAVAAEVAAKQGPQRTRVTFLSATPFAYEKTVDWAEGYLFDYDEGRDKDNTGAGYNSGDNREQFFIQHFGYRMRYNKLTEPDSKVDRGLLQRQFNGWLKKQGVLAGRMLDVAADYDRRFVLVESAIGRRIDEALQWLWDNSRKDRGMSRVREALDKRFDYLSRRYLLEAIKATEVLPHVREHLALGRKVVVFHDYKKGGGFNPFDLRVDSVDDAPAAYARFSARFADLLEYPFASMPAPVDVFRREFPGVLLFNGDVPPKERRAAVEKFQDDASGPQVILVQSAAGKEGISLHDTTGKHQRVLFNLGQPTQPTTAIQQEGRIYRTGQVTNAMFRYLNTGTNWEKWAFATTIAQRASTAENLGMGELARALKDAFIAGFEESGDYRAGDTDEGTGGKARDAAANNAISEYDRARAFYWGTQKKDGRTKAQEGTDYFATPEPLGLKMVQWADVRAGESALEPSGGHGAIARWFPESADRTAIEPSNTLSARLAMVFDGKVVQGDFESHHVVNKYDAIVMNPPFGTAGRAAIDHLAKAATHLRDGGRIVALIPTGPAADKKFDKWFYEEDSRPTKPLLTTAAGEVFNGDTLTSKSGKTVTARGVVTSRGPRGDERWIDVRVPGDPMRSMHLHPDEVQTIKGTGKRTETFRPAEGLHLVADIKLPMVTFERAATKVATRIVVIEKPAEGTTAPAQRTRDYTDIEDINQLFDRLEDASLPPRAKPVADEVAEPEPKKPVKAEKAQAVAAAAAEGAKAAEATGMEIVTVTTNGGKELRGVLRTDLTAAQAKEIDPFTWRPKGREGYFIREKHLAELVKRFPPAGATDSDIKFSLSGEEAAQPAAIRQHGIPADAVEIHSASDIAALKAHPDYVAAKAGDPAAAVQVVLDLVPQADIERAEAAFGSDVIYVYPHAEEASGRNALPAMLANRYAAETGALLDETIVQTNRVFHTGADAMQRLIARPKFTGMVQAGARYVLVDDVTTMGGTFAELANYIQQGGGKVSGIVTLATASRAGKMAASPQVLQKIERRFGDAVREALHIDPAALTDDEARYVIGFRDADELRGRVASAAQARAERLRAKGIRQEAGSTQSLATTAPGSGAIVKQFTPRGTTKLSGAAQDDTLRHADLADPVRLSKAKTYAADPDADNQRIVELLQRGLARARPGFVLSAVEGSHVDGGLRAARALARGVFGHRVIFVQQPAGRLFNGVALDSPGADYVLIDVDSDKPALAVLGHELLHRMRGARPDLYDRLADRLAPLVKDQTLYNTRLSDKRDRANLVALTDDELREELIADVVGDEFVNPEFWRDLAKQDRNWFQRMADYVMGFLDDVIQQVNRKRPFGTDQHLTDLHAARAAVVDAMREFADGGDASSDGKAPGTDTDAFKRWFGDSKVVDPDGKPLVVYHGTASTDISEFLPQDDVNGTTRSMRLVEWFRKLKAQNGRMGYMNFRSGTFFSPDPAYAGNYVGEAGGVMYPVYIKAENPVYMDQRTGEVTGVDPSKTPDALIMRDGDKINEVAVIDPAQIKSAIGNRGTFDPSNPDIRFSLAPADATRHAVLRPSSAPLDKALQLAGGNLLARLTSPTYDRLLQVLDGAGRAIGGTPYLYAKAGLVADYGLTPDYRQARQDMQTGVRRGTREAATVIEQLQTLDRAQSRIAHLWMQEKPDTEAERQLLAQLPTESRETLLGLKERIDQLGKQAVEFGMLSQETYDRNAMAYLHRSYRKYELDDRGAKVARARAVKILGDQFKGRGMRDDVGMASIGSPEWWQRREKAGAADTSLKGQKFVRLELRAQPDTATAPLFEGGGPARLGKLRQVVYWPAGEPVPAQYADWRRDGQWEARFFDKAGKVGMWRDFSLEERTAMGEIQEVRYSAAKTLLQAVRDIEHAKLLDWVARNTSVVSEDQLPEGTTLVKATESLTRPYLDTEWVQVPTASVPGTAGVKRYGNLAGRYVPGPVWNDLRQIQSLTEQGDIARAFGKLMRAWKISKTALSPATHMNNVLSNFILADAHDIQGSHIARAARAWFNSKDRPKLGRKADPAAVKLIEDYQDNGGDGGKFNEGELQEDVMGELIEQLERDVNEQDGATALVSAAQVLDLLRHREFRQAFAAIGQTKTAGRAAAPARALIKLYGHEDELFRLAAFIKAKDDGLSDRDAGQFARASFLDYNINAPWVQALRRTAFPFIAFTYRAVPMLLRVAADRPHKLAKYALVAGALNALAYAMLGGDADDERRERALMPEEKGGRIWGIFPKLMRMPWNDEHGSPVFLDVRRWVPAGDVVDTGGNHAAVPVPSPMVPGGPLVILAELLLNRQSFTGRNITQETDTMAEKWGKAADYLWKSAMPNFPGVPGTYSTKALMDAGRGKTDAFGREHTLGQATLSSLGIKVASYPPDELKRNVALEQRAQIAEIRRGLASDARQFSRRGMTREEFNERRARAVEKIQRLSRELDERMRAAETTP